MLYTSKTFSCKSPIGVIHLADALLPQRFAILESIHLELYLHFFHGKDWDQSDAAIWAECCRILASMPPLRKLSVLLWGSLSFQQTLEEAIAPNCLDGLRMVKEPKEFEVVLPHAVEGYEDAPFRFKTRAEDLREERDERQRIAEETGVPVPG